MDKAATLAALEEAINMGALKVKYGDKEVTYRTLSEMESVRNRLRRELGLAKGAKRTFISTDKGVH